MKKWLAYTVFLVAFAFGAKAQEREQALRLYNEGKYAEAAILFEKLYKSQPDDVNYTSLLECYKYLKRYADAEELISKRQKRQKDPMLFIDLGYYQQLQKKTEEATKNYQNALNTITSNPGMAYPLSEHFAKYALYHQALECYNIAERMNPGMQFHYQKGLLYAELGDMESMVAEYLLLIEDSPNYYQNVRERMARNITSDPGNEVNQVFKRQLIKKIQESQNPLYAQLLIWLYTEEEDYAKALRQQIALDKRGEAMDADIFSLGEKTLEKKVYSTATDCFTYLIAKGNNSPFYEEALYRSLVVRRLTLRTNPETKVVDFKNLLIAHYKSLPELSGSELYVFTLRDAADILYFNLSMPDSATGLLGRTISRFEGGFKRPVGECKVLLGDMLLAQGKAVDAIFTYMQVERTFTESPLGDEAKYKKGMVAYYTFDFMWALTQFEALKSSTTKLISNDALTMALLITDNSVEDTLYQGLTYYAKGDFQCFQNKLDSALITFDLLLSVFPEHAIREETRLYQAKILYQQRRYTEAVAALEAMMATGGDIWADDALMLMGEIYATHLGNTEKAMAAYEKILFDHPGSTFVPEARRRYRSLRGDNLVN